MLVVMKRGATQQEIDAVVARIREFGITPVPLPGAERTAIGTFGSTSREAPGDVDAVAQVADCLQVGARNMQNFALLDAVGEQQKPVLLKRGMSATVEELLLSAEYVLARGNRSVILCERGIRTFEKYTRNTFDVSAVPLLKRLTHLPVIADPSHGTGKWYLVAPVALAAVAAGVDGLMVEVHPSPDHALSDGFESLTFDNFSGLMTKLSAVAGA